MKGLTVCISGIRGEGESQCQRSHGGLQGPGPRIESSSDTFLDFKPRSCGWRRGHEPFHLALSS